MSETPSGTAAALRLRYDPPNVTGISHISENCLKIVTSWSNVAKSRGGENFRRKVPPRASNDQSHMMQRADMTNQIHSRRNFLTWISGTLGLTAAIPASAADLTAPATEGPFYPTASMRRVDTDNDLVKILGYVQDAGGEVFMLKGRITEANGAPLANHRIEIWQCDLNGKYLHSGDLQDIEFDPAFQGFGHDITGPDGTYSFRTIKPVTYPGRTPHIHVKVFDGEREILTTQFYISGHPANRRDGIFNRLTESQANAVSMVFETAAGGEVATVNIVV